MEIFETVSFHIVKPCNASCKFCYATFNDMNVKMMSEADACNIIIKLKKAGVQKITFAGGEPMMYPYLDNVIRFTKHLELTTSIISNGFLMTQEWLEEMRPYLDWVGISIDSLNHDTNVKIGRMREGERFMYYHLIGYIKDLDYKLKINTVVNKYNQDECMQDFISTIDPDRWKIFDTLRVEGQNDKQFEDIRTTRNGFKTFVSRHNHPSMVVEDNNLMTGSYLLIDPQGRMFENSGGKHTYSRSLLTNTVDECLSDINLNRKTFLERGGIYNW